MKKICEYDIVLYHWFVDYMQAYKPILKSDTRYKSSTRLDNTIEVNKICEIMFIQYWC